MRRIVIVGAGDQGRVVADILRAAHTSGDPAEVVGFVDDARFDDGALVAGLRVLGTIEDLPRVEHDGVVVAVGDNGTRRRIFERLEASGERLVIARHPSAIISAGATIGDGSMISPGSIVIAGARIGRGVILNTKSSVDHDSEIGDFTHIALAVTIGGHVRIGDETLIALGASVASGCSVGARTVIGAGAVVLRSIPADVVAWGIPARVTTDRRSPGSTSR